MSHTPPPIQRDIFGGRVGEYAVPRMVYVSTCHACGADMVWIMAAKGARIPLSVATIETRDDQRYALPHCMDGPDAKEWRKKP